MLATRSLFLRRVVVSAKQRCLTRRAEQKRTPFPIATELPGSLLAETDLHLPPPRKPGCPTPSPAEGGIRWGMGTPRLTSPSRALTALQRYRFTFKANPSVSAIRSAHHVLPRSPRLPLVSCSLCNNKLTSSVLRAPTLRMCTSPTTTKLTPQPTPPPPSLRVPSSPPSPSASRTWAPRSTSRPSQARTSSSLSRAREYCCLRDSARRPVLADRHRSHRCWSG